MTEKRFQSFSEFYPYYLNEHSDATCRTLHYIGSLLVLSVLFWAVVTGIWSLLITLPIIGYGFAWVGHFGFEHNKPATFQYPFYSLMGDWVMLKDFLTGNIDQKLQDAQASH
ncbi:hypothetical protein A9Q81_14270 [Gammaproteobacteria bacterium 42_54_T18]|mgnify:FL=1|nr:hypothetical protein A9Q81_14270 [Gammaproteobacteria bacterium 42_54_T18]